MKTKSIILVIEDDKINAFILWRFLQNDYEVISMRSAEEAIDYLKENLVECILMDINLGHNSISGSEALEKIRAMEGYDHLPIIAVTAYSSIGDKEKFLSEGFNDYVSKPVDRRRIIKLLQNHLNTGVDLSS